MKLKSVFKIRKWVELYICSKYAERLSDKSFLKLKYYAFMGKKLNLDNPRTYNEKLQWLKLYDRNPLYTIMVDKHEAKRYVANVIGEKYIIPELGLWNTPDEIDFDSLPERFVLKVTHDSGGLVICRDKSMLDVESAKAKLMKSLNRDYYRKHREWPYKNVKRRIIAEEYMEDQKTAELRDYKFFCFDGEVRLMFVATGRQEENKETRFDFFDAQYNHLNIKNGHPMAEYVPEKPQNYELMKELAEKLSHGIPHVRVDFYEVNGQVYFGEMTFSHWSGFVPFEPESWDETLGSWINLPSVKRG